MQPERRQIVRLQKDPALETLTVTTEATPGPGPGQVLMRVHASSLNFHDYYVAAGHIPQPAGRVPMSDGAGEVVALGAGVTAFAAGDRVIGAFFPDWVDGRATPDNTAAISGETIDGFAANYVTVAAHSLCRIPDDWSFGEAATLPCAGLTAWRALKVEGELKAGDSLLLPGSGGLAVFCHQLAHAMGIVTIAISSSNAKLARLAELGATHLINYRDVPNWSERIAELTNGMGVDAALDIGGQSTFAQSIEAVRHQGRVMVVGTTANQPPALPLRDIIMRGVRVQGMAVGSVAQFRNYLDFVVRHDLRPVIDRTFPLERLGDAFAYQLRGEHFGKIAVTM